MPTAREAGSVKRVPFPERFHWNAAEERGSGEGDGTCATGFQEICVPPERSFPYNSARRGLVKAAVPWKDPHVD